MKYTLNPTDRNDSDTQQPSTIIALVLSFFEFIFISRRPWAPVCKCLPPDCVRPPPDTGCLLPSFSLSSSLHVSSCPPSTSSNYRPHQCPRRPQARLSRPRQTPQRRPPPPQARVVAAASLLLPLLYTCMFAVVLVCSSLRYSRLHLCVC